MLLVVATPAVASDDLIARFECNRCHDGAQMPRDKHCVRCHQDIERGTFDAAPETLARWQRDIVHFVDVPSLKNLSLRREWIVDFLLKPTKIRHASAESMPRLKLTRDQAASIASALVPNPPDETPLNLHDVDLNHGKTLFTSKGCSACHVNGAGPDVALMRARLTPRALLHAIATPRGAMPRIALTVDEQRALAKYILQGRFDRTPPPAPARLPILSRKVTWDEVNARVFRKSCWHCHSNADLANGDGGPGNTGGFGYEGAGISFASYSEVMQGGSRGSIFPRLLDVLLARQREERGELVDGIVGMPLGLPSLTPEEIQLVETWIAQGRAR